MCGGTLKIVMKYTKECVNCLVFLDGTFLLKNVRYSVQKEAYFSMSHIHLDIGSSFDVGAFG